MRHNIYQLFKKIEILFLLVSILLIAAPTALAAESPLITSVNELTSALMNAKPGDTILVGDITFQPMPMGMIIVPQNIRSRAAKIRTRFLLMPHLLLMAQQLIQLL